MLSPNRVLLDLPNPPRTITYQEHTGPSLACGDAEKDRRAESIMARTPVPIKAINFTYIRRSRVPQTQWYEVRCVYA